MRRLWFGLSVLLFALPAILADQASPSRGGLTTILVGPPVARTKVPDILAQGEFLSPQAISAVDVSDDGQTIAVTTMAFRHDRNFWALSDKGKVLWGRTVLPWAPYQVGVAGKGKAFAVGLAYSRVTPPHPTMALFQDEKSEETALTDPGGERGWLRYGSGDWRTGWLVSAPGDQLVRSGDQVFTIATNNGAWQLTDAGSPRKLPPSFPSQRPFRLAASRDSKVVAFTYLVPDVRRLNKGSLPESVRVAVPPALVGIHGTDDWKVRGKVQPSAEERAIPPLPDPVKDYPDLAKQFRLRADALLPFRVAVTAALNADGSRIAFIEYAGWLWVRSGPAIGKWDPPYHVIPFVPRQRGWLHIVNDSGEELGRSWLPTEGLFDVRLDDKGERTWCYPAAWFARGMAGRPWLPADPDARSVFGYLVAEKKWTTALQFPDAISDLVVSPSGKGLLVSCWDGKLYRLDSAGQLQATVEAGSPARLTWCKQGGFVIAGTQRGEILCLADGGKLRWKVALPEAELPPLTKPIPRVFEDVPIYQVGRVGPEHAYVGDTWLVKTARGGFLIDTGGTSGIPFTRQRLQSVGVDLKNVRYLLHSHSHGDHCGAGYLWRAMGLKVVAPESANFTLTWLMPMLTDYGVWVPRPVDIPLPLRKAGDETEIALDDLKVRAIFVPGHSFDSVLYAMELAGKRVLFTGDIGFDNQDILHRCWGDVEKAKRVTEVVRTKALAFKPDYVFRGHGAKRDGTAFLEDLVKRSEEAIRKAEKP